MHTYIHQLRRQLDRALGDAAELSSRDVLVTERGGYSLHAHGAETDVDQFRRSARAGTVAFESGDHRAASELLGRALALWRGPLLADIQIGPVLSLEAMALDDLQTAALHRRIEADLHLGRHQEVLGELRTLSRQNPINENFAAHYMVSLYHSGRVGSALEEFQRIRTTLITELGVEPAARLQRLQTVILSGGRPLEDPMVTGRSRPSGRLREIGLARHAAVA